LLATIAECYTRGSDSSYISKTIVQHTKNTLLYSTRVSQGSVTTRIGYVGIANDSCIANFSESWPIKNFENPLKLAKLSIKLGVPGFQYTV